MLRDFSTSCYSYLVATGILIVGCESKSVTTTTQATVPAQPASLAAQPASPIQTESATDTLAVQPSSSEDNPELPKPFEKVKRLAPGLAVLIKSVPVPGSTSIREPSDLRLTFSIKYNGRVIFRDTANDGLSYTYYALPQTEKLYPMWIPTGRGSGELLVAFNNRPSKELARRFIINNFQVTRIDTLLTFNGPATDVDKDGKLEYAGFYDFAEAEQAKQGRIRRMYVPTLYYEVRPGGLVLDSALTRKKAITQYGAFYGYKDSNKPVIYAK